MHGLYQEPVKLENIKRLKKAGANKIVSPEVIGGEGLYYESASPHLLRVTVSLIRLNPPLSSRKFRGSAPR